MAIKFSAVSMVFKMDAALQQTQWNMSVIMADNDEPDSDEAISDDEGIEGFNVSLLPLFSFVFTHYLLVFILAFYAKSMRTSFSPFVSIVRSISFVSLL